MSKSANIVSAIHHMKIADEYLQDFIRQHPLSKGATIFRNYSKKIGWMLMDLSTNPNLPDDVRNGIRQELKSDVFAIPAIYGQISLLKPEQREAVEEMIKTILNGAELTVAH